MIFRERSSLPHMRIARLAETTSVHQAFRWLHLQEPRIRAWQRELTGIAAPPLGEDARAAWFAERLTELQLVDVTIDAEGNATGLLRADDGASPLVLLSAHLDTVFPAGTDLTVYEEDAVLRGPGVADNGAGLAGLLALAAALRVSGVETGANVLFAANVGEEAEGNLRGMRYLFGRSPYAARICASIALEGAGTGTVVTRGLGSRRFRVELTGPGGHAWTDTATPNPIVALAAALTALSAQPMPERPRTTLNIGEMHGGTSVTAVPQTAEATIDIRSTDPDNILTLEVRLYRAVEDAVLAANRGTTAALRATITCIGDRPAAELKPNSPLLEAVRAVDRHLRLSTEERLGSTDANIPLALGLEAIAIGAGGTAGGIHTTNEWYDTTGRELALRRILLLLLDVCGYTCGQLEGE